VSSLLSQNYRELLTTFVECSDPHALVGGSESVGKSPHPTCPALSGSLHL